MTNLITNKHKRQAHGERATVFTKRQASRRVRRDANVAAENPSNRRNHRPLKNAARKRSGVCPVCLKKLKKNKRGTRYQHTCDSCHAQLKPDIRCGRCGTYRVWTGPAESRCKGCGNSMMPQKTEPSRDL